MPTVRGVLYQLVRLVLRDNHEALGGAWQQEYKRCRTSQPRSRCWPSPPLRACHANVCRACVPAAAGVAMDAHCCSHRVRLNPDARRGIAAHRLVPACALTRRRRDGSCSAAWRRGWRRRSAGEGRRRRQPDAQARTEHGRVRRGRGPGCGFHRSAHVRGAAANHVGQQQLHLLMERRATELRQSDAPSDHQAAICCQPSLQPPCLCAQTGSCGGKLGCMDPRVMFLYLSNAGVAR